MYPLLGVHCKESRSCLQDHCGCARFFVAPVLRPVLRSPPLLGGRSPRPKGSGEQRRRSDNAVKDLSSYHMVLTLPVIVLMQFARSILWVADVRYAFCTRAYIFSDARSANIQCYYLQSGPCIDRFRDFRDPTAC